MRVDQTSSNQVQGTEVSSARKTGKAAETKNARKTAQSESAAQADSSGDVKAEISTKGREIAKAKAVADGAPDVREEKIAELKRRIAGGKYHVDAEAVADKMVDDHIKMSGMS